MPSTAGSYRVQLVLTDPNGVKLSEIESETFHVTKALEPRDRTLDALEPTVGKKVSD